jgi:hypothetical protein
MDLSRIQLILRIPRTYNRALFRVVIVHFTSLEVKVACQNLALNDNILYSTPV